VTNGPERRFATCLASHHLKLSFHHLKFSLHHLAMPFGQLIFISSVNQLVVNVTM